MVNTKVTKDMISIRDELRPGDVGYLIHLHGWIYAKECGFNHEFEGYVCKTFYDFYNRYSPDKDRIWFAEYGSEIVGAIAIVGHTPTRAQLRWFILHPSFRGLGLGRTLMNKAMDFCKEKGYTNLFLETTVDQKTAVEMYLKAGFRVVSEEKVTMWGRDLLTQTYELG
ncbi:MAG: GNAT family N-acetyltransferase [Saccharofermentanales bacterium]